MWEILSEFPGLVDVGYDKWRSQKFATILEEQGVPVFGLKQGPVLTPAIWEFKDLVDGGGIAHGGDPVLRYAAESSIMQRLPGDKAMITKPDRETDSRRVDPIIAALSALMRLQAFREEKKIASGVSIGGAKGMSQLGERERREQMSGRRKLIVV